MLPGTHTFDLCFLYKVYKENNENKDVGERKTRRLVIGGEAWTA